MCSSRRSWDMTQERVFLEQLVGQRSNFLLVFYSLVIAGAVSSRQQIHLQCILLLGFFITLLTSLSVYRAHRKSDLAIRRLFKTTGHPAATINDLCNKLPLLKRGFSARWAAGWVIPLICTLSLLVGLGCSCYPRVLHPQ
ncbi:hypothetical protein ACFL6X_03635 [Candidatus Latescibacterota bacterium]